MGFTATDTTAQFAQKYKAAHSKDLTPTAVLCYDGLSIVIDACLESPGTTPAKVVAAKLEGRKHAGVYGPVDVRGREIIYPLEIRVAE